MCISVLVDESSVPTRSTQSRVHIRVVEHRADEAVILGCLSEAHCEVQLVDEPSVDLNRFGKIRDKLPHISKSKSLRECEVLELIVNFRTQSCPCLVISTCYALRLTLKTQDLELLVSETLANLRALSIFAKSLRFMAFTV